MRDQLLFAVAPYVAALLFTAACIVRYVLWRRLPDRETTESARGDGRGLADVTWRWALGVVALGHLLAFVFPTYLLQWDRQVFRLAILEGFGAIAGSIAIAGLLATLLRKFRLRDKRGVRRPADVIAATLVLVGMTSGVATAVIYRWASSWSEVTVVPYLDSLVRFDPATNLVARLPVLVRLHIFCALAILAILPLTGMARFVLVPADRLTRWTQTRLSGIRRPSWHALEAWFAAQVRALSARVLRNREEEN
jgi:nitrate reductase gamma subunit